MAQGAASPAPPTPPAGALGPHSPRSGSSFFDRFNRRPRTANSTHHRNLSSNNSGSGGNFPSTFSTESLTGTPTSTGGHSAFARQQGQPAALARSSSSNNVNQQLMNFPRDSHTSPPATPPAINQNRNPMSAIGAAASSPAPGASSSSSGALGRMFRRYSHGAGKNASQDAAATARGAVANGSGSQAAGASSAASPPGAGPSSPSSRPSALRSLSNHFLPSSSSLSIRPNATADSLTRTLSNQIAALPGGMYASGAPRSSVDYSTAAMGRPSGHSAATGGSSSVDLSAGAGVGDAVAGSAATGGASVSQHDSSSGQAGPSTTVASNSPNLSQGYRIRLVPHLEASRSLHFEPIERELRDGAPPLKIGRFTERTAAAAQPGTTVGTAGAAAPVTAATREGLGTASGPGTGSAGPGVTLNNSARSGAIDVDMAGMGTLAHGAAGAATSAVADSASATAAQGARRQPERARANNRLDARIAFKSKVVSRGHAEIWCENGGNFFLRDTKSSSGTFLNHIRLSAPGVESRPFRIKDGDVVQLGVDYQGGTEEIYRCVKMRIELNRGWQREANQYNVNALRQLRALQGSPMPATPTGNETDKALTTEAVQGATVSAVQQPPTSVTDCCICLFSVTVCQALFIAPCSHVFHYKCIRPLLTMHHPGFSCPLCRTFADLEADVEQDEEWQADLMRQATQGIEGTSTPSVPAGPTPVAAAESMSAQPTLATAGATPSASAAPPLATVPEAHSRQGSQAPASNDVRQGGSSQDTSSQLGRRPSHNDDDAQEVLQDDDDELMEDFSGGSGRQSGAEDDMDVAESDSVQAAFGNPANLSLSASGFLAARRSLNSSAVAGGPAVSEPITMPVAANAPISGSAGTSVSASAAAALEEARTPMNQHFLSTLAESSPGGPAFFNAAAASARAAAASAVSPSSATRNGPTSNLAIANGISAANGHSGDTTDESAEADADRLTPGAVGVTTSTTTGVKRSATDADAVNAARHSSGTGGVHVSTDGSGSAADGSAPSRDEIMSD